MCKARFTDIAVMKSVEARCTFKDVCRVAGISEATFYSYELPSTESGFRLLLTSIRYQKYLCPNG